MHVQECKKSEIPFFKVPYPPELTVEEILSRRKDERRAPNQFLIYRLAYLKALRSIRPRIGKIGLKKFTNLNNFTLLLLMLTRRNYEFFICRIYFL